MKKSFRVAPKALESQHYASLYPPATSQRRYGIKLLLLVRAQNMPPPDLKSTKFFLEKCPDICEHLRNSYRIPRDQTNLIYESIPYLRFPPHWLVKICYGHTGAVARFLVSMDGLSEEDSISVYLDFFSNLGICRSDETNELMPYYEIYPSSDGEPSRFFLYEHEKMIEEIEKTLQKKLRKVADICFRLGDSMTDFEISTDKFKGKLVLASDYGHFRNEISIEEAKELQKSLGHMIDHLEDVDISEKGSRPQ